MGVEYHLPWLYNQVCNATSSKTPFPVPLWGPLSQQYTDTRGTLLILTGSNRTHSLTDDPYCIALRVLRMHTMCLDLENLKVVSFSLHMHPSSSHGFVQVDKGLGGPAVALVPSHCLMLWVGTFSLLSWETHLFLKKKKKLYIVLEFSITRPSLASSKFSIYSVFSCFMILVLLVSWIDSLGVCFFCNTSPSLTHAEQRLLGNPECTSAFWNSGP